MKSFLKFLSESAAQQAARLGLQGDGHGGWYDRSTGEFVAKTEKGRLKFCLLYTSPSPRDLSTSRMPSSA